MSNVPSILSMRIDRAYGLRPAESVRPKPVARIAAAAPTRSDATPAGIRSLIGAVVPGRIGFDDQTGAPVPTAGPIPMYRSPADRNAAAVSVEIGRSIDVRG